jgi:uncharacterized membrane protein
MTASLMDWLSLLLRWAHVMAGIGWIGTSFYFIWLDESLRRRAGQDPRLAGESWMVHGGGFYKVDKYLVAPETLPDELHWFKYEAYLTWLTGFLLLAVIYYWGAESFLVGPTAVALTPAMAVTVSIASLAAGWLAYDLLCRSAIGANTALLAVAVFVLITLAAFGYAQVFPGRAAFLHVGSFIGTIMAANVFAVIIPNQKKTVAALTAGEAPDAKYGAQAKQRSLHNNYLTLPVVFMMISNHSPLTYGHRWNWLVAVGVLVAGVLVRHFFNAQDAGRLTPSAKAALPGAAVLVVALALVTSWRPAPEAGEAVAFAEVHTIVRARCASCHAAKPTDEDFEQAPGGIMFDTPEELRRYASRIEAQTVLTEIMPLGNKTGMTEDERRTLGAWIVQGAPLD